MCEMLKCRGVAVSCVPHRSPEGGRGIYGGVQFQLFADHKTHFLNHERAVGVVHDGHRNWEFDAIGPVQDFEETTQYDARRVVDRFTPEMLGRYCAALGMDLFNPDFYGPNAIMVKNKSPLRPDSPCLSRQEARKRLGVE